MAQTPGFDPTSQVKTCFDCKMFDVANWVTYLNGENGPGGTPSHEALSVSPQGALEISSVVEQPPSLDRNHFSTPRVVAESLKCDERCKPSSQRPQYPTLYRRLKRRLGRSLRANLYKGSVVRQVLVATDNSTVVAYINEQGGTHSSEMCALLWKIMTWCHHYQITLKARHIPGCDGRPSVQVKPSAVSRMVTASTGVQTDLSKVVHPHVDLFATRLNHKLPLYVSPVPDPNSWDIDALNINSETPHCLCLPSDSSPSQGDPKNQAMQLPDHCNSPRLARDALVLGPSTTEIPLQLPVSTTLLKQSHNYVFHSNPQHLNLQAWCLGVDASKNKASLWRWQRELLPLKHHQQGPSTIQSEPYLDFSTPSVKQVSDFFMYLYQDLNRRPSTIDGYRTAIVDTLGPTGHYISQSSDLNRLLSSFHRDRSKSSRNLLKRNLSVVLNELTKAPFEPMKDTDLKHLTLKTAFLLDLTSGKCRSKSHAWVANKVSKRLPCSLLLIS